MKPTLAILFCTLLLIPAFAVCVSANEVYIFSTQYFEPIESDAVVCIEAIPAGEYIIKIQTNGGIYVSKEPVVVSYSEIETNAGLVLPGWFATVSFVNFPIEADIALGFVVIDGVSVLDGVFPPDLLDFNSQSVVAFERCNSDFSALPSVNDTLDTCINWVGQVLNALISGELNGLLLLAAIPIAITVVMLSIKFIRRNSWGC